MASAGVLVVVLRLDSTEAPPPPEAHVLSGAGCAEQRPGVRARRASHRRRDT